MNQSNKKRNKINDSELTNFINKKISRRNAIKYTMVIGAISLLEACKRRSGTLQYLNENMNANPALMATSIDTKNGNNKVSLLGFGCMRFPVNDDGKLTIDEELASKMIDYAYSHGINYYDTAYPYHDGLSETFIGKALKKYPRESFYLADKLPSWLINSVDDAKRIFQEQLNKCQVEYFDYFLCHAISDKESYDKVYEQAGVYNYLIEEKKAGRIKRLGFSFHGNPETLQYLLDLHNWDFIQIQLNYYDWDDPEQQSGKLYNMIYQRHIPIIIMEPNRGGTLSQLNVGCKKMITDAEPDATPTSLALRFAASLPGVLTVLSGMSKLEHVVENINTFTNFKPITEQEKALLTQVANALKKNFPIGCTGCKYCMPCPHGVNIPAVFAAYNKCATDLNIPDIQGPKDNTFNKKKKIFLNIYNKALSQNEMASNCIKCGRCLNRCPQHIPIPDNMEKIANIVSVLQ